MLAHTAVHTRAHTRTHTHTHTRTLARSLAGCLQLLKDEFAMGLHALVLDTKTPAEAGL